MRSRLFREQHAVLLVLVGAILIGAQGFLFYSLFEQREARNSEREQHDFSEAVLGLEQAITEAEADVRGYHITLAREFLGDYERERQDAQDALASVEQLRPESASINQVNRLNQLVERRLDLLDEAIVTRDQEGLPAVADLVLGEPTTLTREIRTLSSALVASTGRAAAEQASDADRQAIASAIAAGVASLAGLGAFGWVAALSIARARAAQRAGEVARSQLGAFADALPSASFSIDQDRRVIDWNPAAAARFGVPPEQAVGSSIEQVLPMEAAAEIHAALLSALQGAGPIDLDVRYQAQGVALAELSGLAFPIPERGQPMAGAILRDVTDLRAAERDRESYRQMMSLVVSASAEAIVTVNGNGAITLFNAAAEQLFRIPASEALGRALADFLAERTRSRVLEAVQECLEPAARGPAPRRLPAAGRRIDGAEVPLDCSLVGFSLEGRPLCTLTMRDVTEQERWEQSIMDAHAEAAAANQAKSDFLSRMSHELRTPMNVILGFAQILDLEEHLSNDERDSIAQILKAGRHLLTLIDEVLDISRIESGHMSISLEPVVLGEVIGDGLDLLRPLAAENGVEIRADAASCRQTVMADKQRFKQIVINLVSNAIKYNVRNGWVELACEHLGADFVRLNVRDSGLGMSEAQLERIFQPFERLGAENSPVQGTGLGLALSKRLAEAMSGSVGVSSQPGKGSNFWVDLPEAAHTLGSSQQVLDLPAAGLLTGRSRGTVLYIEDNLANLRVVERLLGRFGQIRLLPAMQGRVGVELAQRAMPDLVLLDLHLPDIPGEEVLRLLRRDDSTRAIPVVVISADASAPRRERLREAGVAGYLTKPIDVPQFLRTVAMFLPGADHKGQRE